MCHLVTFLGVGIDLGASFLTDTNSNPRYGFGILAYLMMVLGMAAHGGFNHFTEQTPWAWNAFGAAFVVSPIVFFMFLALLKSEIDNLTGALISFQNGFFWKELFQAAGPLTNGAGS